jgi:parallel beta-helix repeat protein
MLNSSSNIILKNLMTDNFREGILLRSSNDNNISENIIVNNTYGVDVGDSTNNKINWNEISYNTYGIEISFSLKNRIMKNNFRKNIVFNAYNVFTIKPFWRNIWDANFWNRSKVFPQFIFGYIETAKGMIIPWANVDWHPAQKPYNISI